MHKLRTAILISGRGSNMQAIVNAQKSKDFPASVELVISNREDAKGLEFAKEKNIPSFVVPHGNFQTKADFEQALLQILGQYEIDLVCLAGFMRLLSSHFISAYEGRIINIHPSLLPLYKGLDTHKRALDAGDAYTGCSVHYVVPEMDAGAVILQDKVSIKKGDTPETLAEKTLKKEHIIYPQAIRIVAERMKSYNFSQNINHTTKSGETMKHNSFDDLEQRELRESWKMWVKFTKTLQYSIIATGVALLLLLLIWL